MQNLKIVFMLILGFIALGTCAYGVKKYAVSTPLKLCPQINGDVSVETLRDYILLKEENSLIEKDNSRNFCFVIWYVLAVFASAIWIACMIINFSYSHDHEI